jgi:hypothetical protein
LGWYFFAATGIQTAAPPGGFETPHEAIKTRPKRWLPWAFSPLA